MAEMSDTVTPAGHLAVQQPVTLSSSSYPICPARGCLASVCRVQLKLGSSVSSIQPLSARNSSYHSLPQSIYKHVHLEKNIFFIKEVSLKCLASFFVEEKSTCGGVWTRDNLQGVIQMNRSLPVVVWSKGRRMQTKL